MTRWTVPTRADPQRTTGTEYRQPGPPCVCGQPEAVHEVKHGVRGKATAGYPTGPVKCGGYQPAGGSR